MDGPFAGSQVHEPGRVLLHLRSVGSLPEFGKLFFEVGGGDVGGAVDSGLEERFDVDVNVFFFPQEVEVGVDGGSEGRDEYNFYFFVGELVLEGVVLFVGFVGEFCVYEFGVGLYFFAIAEVGLCFCGGGEVFLFFDGLYFSVC